MPSKRLSVDEQTQIGIIIDMLEGLQSEVRIAESARREREKDADETLLILKHAVKGNGKPGLESRMQTVESKVIFVAGVIVIAGGGIIADLLKHYFP